MFGSHPPVLHPAGWTFPQLLSLLTSNTELSYLPPTCFPPSHFPIVRCRDITLLLWAGRSDTLFTSSLPALRLQSCPTTCPPHPSALPCTLLPVLGSASAAQASPSHSWTIVPASSPASWPPVCPPGSPRSVFVHSELSLILLCSRPSQGTPEPWNKV